MIGRWLLNPLLSIPALIAVIMLTCIWPLVAFIFCLAAWVLYDLITDYRLRNEAYRYRLAEREMAYWVDLALQGAEQMGKEK